MKYSKITFGSIKSLKNYSHVVLICDSSLNHYKKDLIRKISNKSVSVISVQAKETSKSISQAIKIYKTLSKKNVDKKSVLVALGGGVVGDIAGFVASTYLRGLPFISVPTTILSQVDSSIGGKNGVNLETGKNLVGTFYQPDSIVIDFNYLKTLSKREIISGLGEILKYSILDKKIKFPEFEDHKFDKSKFLRTIQKLTPLCVNYKMKLVKKDEHDEKGIRQALNLGHTFGHVLETLTSYKKYKHGEAVIWGIKFACVVSYSKGLMSFENFRDIMNLANKMDIPKLPKNLNAKKCYEIALKDKKSYHQTVNMVLLKKIGDIKTRQSVTREEFVEAVNLLKDFS
ncbi:MAG: 3-dehydroquinate synthase [Bdellovibrionota bacterium]